MTLRAAVPDDAELYKVCALCGVLVSSREQADEICRDMDTDTSAPKDGTHIFACDASIPYGQYWTFGQRPPTVVHWFEDGFYTSVNELEPQRPFPATHWQSLPVPPTN